MPITFLRQVSTQVFLLPKHRASQQFPGDTVMIICVAMTRTFCYRTRTLSTNQGRDWLVDTQVDY